MTNILLICSAGMSTSMMVEQMKNSAKEQNIDAEIWAVAEVAAQDNIDKADVILLGPQLGFKLKQIEALAEETPIEVIDMRDYGMMDGKSVLESALKLSNK